MRRPERRIDEMHSTDIHIIAVGYIYKSRPHGFKVCAVRIDLTPYPELTPETQSVTIDCSLARYCKTVYRISVYASRKIFDCLPFETCSLYGIMAYIIYSLKDSPLFHIKMC